MIPRELLRQISFTKFKKFFFKFETYNENWLSLQSNKQYNKYPFLKLYSDDLLSQSIRQMLKS